MERADNCLVKLKRMNDTLNHVEADRIPISDFFQGSFLKGWKKDLNLPEDTDIQRYYDRDLRVTMPNMDPHIKQFEIIEDESDHITVRTGFEAIIKKK